MSRDYFIFKSGRVERKNNTLNFEHEDGNRFLPIEDVDNLYLFGEVDLNTKFLNFMGQNIVPIHFFNYYGFYTGSFYPREKNVSGEVLVRQAEHYLDQEKRLFIAKELVLSARHNILRNIRYYANRGKNLNDLLLDIEKREDEILNSKTVLEVMSAEGRIRDRYYKTFEEILGDDFKLDKRVKRPPNNMINCLISFINSLMYTTVLGEIYKTQLNPTISYLHETQRARFSLSLDIAEIFKPIIADKLIFKLVNKSMISEKDFDEDLNYCYLNEKGRKKIISEYDEKLKTTINHRRMKRNVSYKLLIKYECYKLIKHLIGMETYEGLKAWW